MQVAVGCLHPLLSGRLLMLLARCEICEDELGSFEDVLDKRDEVMSVMHQFFACCVFQAQYTENNHIFYINLHRYMLLAKKQ